VEDAPRPGQAQLVVTPQNIAAVEAIVMENRRVTQNDIAACSKISHDSAHHIVHDVLQFHKVSARWVPRQLTPELRERRADACEEILRRFEREGDGFLARIVTGDETWVHFHQPETKRASKEWRHSSSPKPKKFRTEPSAGKVILTLFWDEKCVILERYTPRGTIVTSASYSDLLKKSSSACNQIKATWASGVPLQHDNATVATITDLHFKCLPHPLYSPDLAPSDFHMFETLKEAMGGKKFRSDEEVCHAVHEWLHRLTKEFFPKGIYALCKRWTTCIERGGDCVEK